MVDGKPFALTPKAYLSSLHHVKSSIGTASNGLVCATYGAACSPYRRLAIETLVVAGVLAVLLAVVLGLNRWLTDAGRDDSSPADIGRIGDVVSRVLLFDAPAKSSVSVFLAISKIRTAPDYVPGLIDCAFRSRSRARAN